jgi:hypothetical protein
VDPLVAQLPALQAPPPLLLLVVVVVVVLLLLLVVRLRRYEQLADGSLH